MSIMYKLNQRIVSFVPKKGTEAVYIYGSFVSGGYKHNKSDIDHLIVIEDKYCDVWQDFVRDFVEQVGIPSDWINVCCKSAFAKACAEGNYFFWSIRISHRLVYKKTNFTRRAFSKMPIYTGVREDLKGELQRFRQINRSVEIGKIDGQDTRVYVAHFFRNACINLLYLYGYIEFNKIRCAEKCQYLDGIKLPFSLSKYRELFDESTKIGLKELRYWFRRYLKFYDMIMEVEVRTMNRNFRSPLYRYMSKY